MSSLTQRLREVLAETGGERSALESQRAELAAERDAKIDAIRTEYAGRIGEIDADLAIAKRVERALETREERAKYAKPKAAAPKRSAMRSIGTITARPSVAKLREVLAVIEAGHASVSDITPRVSFSRGTVENAIPVLREDGLIRLAGEESRPNATGKGASKVRVYRVTPAGTEFINANRTANGAHA